jgi:predicted dehydrogenase
MRFAVVGCGSIAQIMHIPNVLELPETDLVALCDPGENVTAELGDRYNVPPEYQYQDADDLFEERADDIDAVIVTTPMQTHVDVVEGALEADLHTLVEKPLAVTPADADRLVELAEDTDATAMVAYNRRFELAYDRFVDELSAVETVDSATAYAVDADFSQSIPHIYDTVQPDLSEEFIEKSNANRLEQCKQAIGMPDEELAAAYDFQLEHVCHDINLLRDVFGSVESIDHVDFVRDGYFATAHLVYEGGERVLLQSGDSERHFHEQFLRVDAPDRVLNLEFDHPFVRYNGATLSVRSGTGETADCKYSPTREESFKRELEHFVACVQGEETVETTFAEARDDIELITSLFDQ